LKKLSITLDDQSNEILNQFSEKANSSFELGKVQKSAIISQLIRKGKINVEELQKESLSEKTLLEKIRIETNPQKRAELSAILANYLSKLAENPDSIKARPGKKRKENQTSDQ
jgi:uncharacterized membrane protein YcaP (DUF421 family)